ncbi:MAG: nucleoside transporter C-terminal domain-containing protein [Bdellovibrionota bacterium]
MNHPLRGFAGIIFIICIAFLCSRNRRAIRWKQVGSGILMQFAFAIAILGIPSAGIPGVFRFVFDGLNFFVITMIDFASAGSKFVFGPLAEVRDPWGFIFAFRALPSIVFFSAVMALLYHLGVLQKVVKGFAIVMQKTLRTSGAETLSGTANIFMGQTEAPLLIRPFVARMTPSEIYCVMVGGMATIASGVEAAYVGLLKERIPEIAGHLLTASVLGAMGGLVISKIIFPETGEPLTAATLEVSADRPDANAMEAVARGASEGMQLALNVAAMLIAFISLIAVLDTGVAKIGEWFHVSQPISFSILLGHLCRPVAWLIGVPWSESASIGRTLGEKVVINEFVSYVHLAQMSKDLSDRTLIIASYALCGFANFSSIGIQIGGIGGMAPEQRGTLARLGLLAVLGGNLACFLSACVAGILF